MNNALTVKKTDVAKAMFKNKDNYKGQTLANLMIVGFVLATFIIVAPKLEVTRNLMIEKAPALYQFTTGVADTFMKGGK